MHIQMQYSYERLADDYINIMEKYNIASEFINLEIVSEGIETREQYETMEELGLSYIQGYYFSKPLSERQFLQFLSAKQRLAGE